MGVVLIALAAVAAVALILAGVGPAWLLVLFVPFWIGALGLIQAREKT